MSKDKNKIHTTKLDTTNSNLITFRFEDIEFEILGGINTESFQSLRVMLLVKYQRTIVREQIDLYNSTILTTFIRKVVTQTNLGVKYVEEAFGELTTQLESYKLELIEAPKVSINNTYELSSNEKQQAIGFLNEANLLDRLQELIGQTGIIGNQKNRLILFLTYLSRKQSQPLHSIIQSQHNYLQSKIGQLLPDEDKLEISHLSDNALFYFDENELNNKVLLIEDVDSRNRKRMLPLFDLQTKGYFSKTTTQKDELGQIKAVQRFVRGTGVVLSISTKEEKAFQNSEAYSFTLTEETINEDSMMDYQRKQSAGKVDMYQEKKAIEFIQNLQRIIEPIRVVNPMAQQLVLPKEIINPAVTNVHYLRFIEIITLLHQHQRTKKVDQRTGEQYIETEIEDIQQANELLADILVNKSDVLNRPTRIYLERLKTLIADRTEDKKAFTNSELSMALNVPISTVKRYHSTLVASNHIQPIIGELDRQQGYRYELVNADEYEVLKSTIADSLNKMMLFTQETSSQLTVAQNQNELPKTLVRLDVEEVAHELDGVTSSKGSKMVKSQKQKVA